MAHPFHVSIRQRRFNECLRTLLRRGIVLGPFVLLAVRGRKTGKVQEIPITPIIHGDQWWLVSPYGEVEWVRNVRAAQQVSLTRGRHHRTVGVRELSASESAPLLKEYLRRFVIAQPYFDVTLQLSLDAFAAEAPRHPVFQVVEQR